METLVSACLGVALSAACGLRIFVPPLVMSVLGRAGYLDLGPGAAWMTTTPALVMFGVATALEVGAYFVPWLDHLLDGIAGPAAVLAGIAVSFAVLHGEDPVVRWSLALIAGGGAAAAVQTTTTLLRAASTWTTGGLGNPLVSLAELAGAVVVSVLAVMLPVLAALAIVFFGLAILQLRRRRRAPA